MVDAIVTLDDERKKYTFQFDETKAKINAASKEIGGLMAKGEKDKVEDKKKEVESFKAALNPIEEALAKNRERIKRSFNHTSQLAFGKKCRREQHPTTTKWCASVAASRNFTAGHYRIGSWQKNLTSLILN